MSHFRMRPQEVKSKHIYSETLHNFKLNKSYNLSLYFSVRSAQYCRLGKVTANREQLSHSSEFLSFLI